MTLAELIRRFRVLAHDTHSSTGGSGDDLLWRDADVADWLNEAQQQACMRARLLREDVDPAMCRIALVPGQHSYSLHPKVLEIVFAQIRNSGGQDSRCLRLQSVEWLDANRPHWRTETLSARHVGLAVQGENSIRIVGRVDAGDVLHLEVLRLPLLEMSADLETPEIHEASHAHLVDWALFRAFSIPDAEAFDAARSQQALAAFEAWFGHGPTADLKRSTRVDVEQHVQGWMV